MACYNPLHAAACGFGFAACKVHWHAYVFVKVLVLLHAGKTRVKMESDVRGSGERMKISFSHDYNSNPTCEISGLQSRVRSTVAAKQRSKAIGMGCLCAASNQNLQFLRPQVAFLLSRGNCANTP
jgi:hypothetical protein